jgi:hypothetical protein
LSANAVSHQGVAHVAELGFLAFALAVEAGTLISWGLGIVRRAQNLGASEHEVNAACNPVAQGQFTRTHNYLGTNRTVADRSRPHVDVWNCSTLRNHLGNPSSIPIMLSTVGQFQKKLCNPMGENCPTSALSLWVFIRVWFSYGNCNFALLRELVPALLGKPLTKYPDGPACPEQSSRLYIDYVNAHVFQPVGVPVSACKPSGGTSNILSYPFFRPQTRPARTGAIGGFDAEAGAGSLVAMTSSPWSTTWLSATSF